MLFAGCSDFLDKEPLASGTEVIAFKTPEQFTQAANALYNLEGWKDYNDGSFTAAMMDHELDTSDLTTSGGGTTVETDWRWDKPYSYIRNCNILLEKAEEYDGDKTAINASVGTARFFRAWQHFYLLQLFGGVPGRRPDCGAGAFGRRQGGTGGLFLRYRDARRPDVPAL